MCSAVSQSFLHLPSSKFCWGWSLIGMMRDSTKKLGTLLLMKIRYAWFLCVSYSFNLFIFYMRLISACYIQWVAAICAWLLGTDYRAELDLDILPLIYGYYKYDIIARLYPTSSILLPLLPSDLVMLSSRVSHQFHHL